MLNLMWSILAQGKQYDGVPARRMDNVLFERNELFDEVYSALFPSTLGMLDIQFHIEQYVQLILKSVLRSEALDLDPVNTYEKAALTYPPPGFVSSSPDPLETIYNSAENPTVSFIHNVTVNSVGPAIAFDGGTPVSFTHSNNLSSIIILPENTTIRLSGPLPVGLTDFTIQNNAILSVDWLEIMKRLERLPKIPWTSPDLRKVWKDDLFWANRLSSVLVSTIVNNTVSSGQN